MRRTLFALVALGLLSGCVARGEDPFAYTKKPLYVSTFDLARLDDRPSEQGFRVEDGSIGAQHFEIYVNATKGGALVEIHDPAGALVISTTETTKTSIPLHLGAWRVTVTPQPDENDQIEGKINIYVTRR